MNDEPTNGEAVNVDEAVKGIEESIQFAKKYIEDLLSFFGLNIDVYATTEDNEVIELHVPSTQMNGFLIGQHGDTMRSLQYMASAALKNNGFGVTRVNVDIADYKKQRADRLAETAESWVRQVRQTGQPLDLRPMNAADRRIIHKLAGENGLITESVGDGRDRHVVLKPGENMASIDEDEIEETPMEAVNSAEGDAVTEATAEE